MNWQDATFTLGGFVLAALLLPTALDANAHIPLVTSTLTGLILAWFAVAFASRRQRAPAVAMLMQAALWVVIAVLRS